MFCQQLGGAVFISIGQNVFANKLVDHLRDVTGNPPAQTVEAGATELRDVASATFHGVLLVYNGALMKVSQAALVMVCLSIIGALSMEWKNIKKATMGQQGSEAAGKGETGHDTAGNEDVEVIKEEKEQNKEGKSAKWQSQRGRKRQVKVLES